MKLLKVIQDLPLPLVLELFAVLNNFGDFFGDVFSRVIGVCGILDFFVGSWRGWEERDLREERRGRGGDDHYEG